MAIKIGRKSITTEEDIEKLKELYSKGYEIALISQKMGLSKTWISSHVKSLVESGELQRRPKYTKDMQRRDGKIIPFRDNVDTGKLLALWNAHWSVEDISRDMELNEDQVKQILKEAGK